ncbi:type IV toxin-antitoxin system AbiEi family antitoxin domain-containing protein [Gordonia sp. DT101]|uniref:type IV toxin-antitoxin system AbiEi family antitoxin domain-containing protein n=1 Tax=Gordonia sp. DT101 TaxID=3416545 RepID=UPI003CF0DB3B
MRPIFMHDFPTGRHRITFRRDALAQGFTDNQLARAVSDKHLAKIWPGAFVATADLPSDPEQRHRLRSSAAFELSGGNFALSHESAALQHNLSLLKPQLDQVHFVTGLRTGGRVEKQRHLHSGHLDPADVTTIDGLAVTSLERTAIDVACGGEFAQALAVLDSALRRGADPEVLGELLESRRRGVTQARRALDHADAGAENAGESWGRAQIIAAGLPVPRLQHEFFDTNGDFVGRTDYDWVGKLAAEFDGMKKYERHLRTGETPFDAMRREKEREDALRRLGVMVIRWVWADLRHHRVVPMVREWLEREGIAT